MACEYLEARAIEVDTKQPVFIKLNRCKKRRTCELVYTQEFLKQDEADKDWGGKMCHTW